MKLLLFVGFLFSWILRFTKTTKIKIQHNTFSPIDLHVVFESTNSRPYWSMHFVETMNIGAIEQKTFHSTLFSDSLQGNRCKILLYLYIYLLNRHDRNLSTEAITLRPSSAVRTFQFNNLPSYIYFLYIHIPRSLCKLQVTRCGRNM